MTNKILITGACGFTGSHMVAQASKAFPNKNIIATDLEKTERNEYYTEIDSAGHPQPVYYKDYFKNFNVEFISADLTNSNDVQQLFSTGPFDYIFHTASLFDYFADRETLFTVNVTGTKNLFEEIVTTSPDAEIVHWSTLGVLGDAGFESPKNETSAYNPHNKYCDSKVAQERLVKSYNTNTTIIRPAPIYGPRHNYGVYHILKILQKLPVVPILQMYPRRKRYQFPAIHVHDITQAALYLAKNNTDYSVYNILNNCITQEELLRFLTKKLQCKRVEIPFPHVAYSPLTNVIEQIAQVNETRNRNKNSRPIVDAPMTHYLANNMCFSNNRLKESGYTFNYSTTKEGLTEYIDWCYANGKL